MLCLAPQEVHTDVNDAPERRRGFRIHQSRPVRVYESNVGRFIAGQTHDVSATGLRIQLPMDTMVSVGAVLNVATSPGAGSASRHGMLPARVIWTHRDFRTGLTCGIEFITGMIIQRNAA